MTRLIYSNGADKTGVLFCCNFFVGDIAVKNRRFDALERLNLMINH